MIKVLIVDDHATVRRGIKALLAETDDILAIGEADNGLAAISLSKEQRARTECDPHGSAYACHGWH